SPSSDAELSGRKDLDARAHAAEYDSRCPPEVVDAPDPVGNPLFALVPRVRGGAVRSENHAGPRGRPHRRRLRGPSDRRRRDPDRRRSHRCSWPARRDPGSGGRGDDRHAGDDGSSGPRGHARPPDDPGPRDYEHWDKTYRPRFRDEIMPAAARQLVTSGVTFARDLGAPLEDILFVK